jgi:predicted RNA binding protein with dsRBD fold (UPF0201 family)
MTMGKSFLEAFHKLLKNKGISQHSREVYKKHFECNNITFDDLVKKNIISIQEIYNLKL